MAQARLIPDNFWGSDSGPSLQPAETDPQDAETLRTASDPFRQVNPQDVSAAASQSAPGYAGRTASGNHQADFMSIYGDKAPSARTLEQYFPQFQALYPGSQLKKNAEGWADAIVLPNGQIIDTQRNSGLDHSDAWQWNVAGGPGASPSGFSGGPQIFDDPATKILEGLINGRLDSLSKPIANPAMDAFLGQASKYIEQLNAPVYSEGEEKALRVKFFDQLEQDRQTALRDMTQRLAAMGHGEKSGTIPLALEKVNEHFNRLKAQKENELFTGSIQERQRRLQQALNVGAQAATMQGNQGTQQDARERESVTTGSILPDLEQQRLGQAMQSLGMGGSSPTSLMSSVAQLMSSNQLQQGQSATAWQSVLDYIAQVLRGQH